MEDENQGGAEGAAHPAKGKGKTAPPGAMFVIWCAAGHEKFAPGQMLRIPGKHAEALRSAGHAREASKDEVKHHGDNFVDVG